MSPRRRASHKYPLQLSHFCSAGFAQRLRPPILAVGDWLEAWVGKCWAYTLGQRRLTPGITQTDRGFTGQQSLSAAGLVDFNARWVDSSLGVFASPDSLIPNLFNPQALNRYAYVANNPLRYTDPTGHRFTGECGLFGEERGGSLSPVPSYVAKSMQLVSDSATTGKVSTQSQVVSAQGETNAIPAPLATPSPTPWVITSTIAPVPPDPLTITMTPTYWAPTVTPSPLLTLADTLGMMSTPTFTQTVTATRMPYCPPTSLPITVGPDWIQHPILDPFDARPDEPGWSPPNEPVLARDPLSQEFEAVVVFTVTVQRAISDLFRRVWPLQLPTPAPLPCY